MKLNRFLYKFVPNVIKKLDEDNYEIIIFTNQKGILKNKFIYKSFLNKLQAVCKSLDVPLNIYIATLDDEYRKPSTGMWDHYIKNLKEIDMEKSFYVGDAAGRPATNLKKKDFSNSDKKFAEAIGIKFYTPEEYFLGKTKDEFITKSVDQYFCLRSRVLKKDDEKQNKDY